MSDEEVQRFIAEVCLGGIADGKIECDLLGLLHRDGVSTRDATILARAPRRLALYRRLVRGNLLGVTSRMMPRTRARLNDLANDAFDRSFSAFLATAAPRTHYLRDVPAEFLAWALPTWKANLSIPAYAADLANHELVEFQIAAAPMRSECPPLAELALDRVLLFVTARRLVHYAHAVHTLPPDEGDRSEPVVRNVALFIHRDRDNRVRFLELTPLAAHIVDRLLARVPLGEAIAQACNAEGTPLTESVLASTARVLSDWGERGILLGAEG